MRNKKEGAIELVHGLLLLSGVCLLSACNSEPKLTRLQKSLSQEPPQTMSLEVTSYCSANYSPALYKQMIVRNLGVGVYQGLLKNDSDFDGVVDELENVFRGSLGIRPESGISTADPFSDLLIFRTGIHIPDQSRLRCSGDADRTDDDHDGLLLCEERLLGTDPRLFDTDGDGLPDSLEIRCGLNPLDSSDANLDTDGDGISNSTECKINTPIDLDNRQPSIAQLAYRYKMEQKIIGANSCLVFTVDNIALASAGGPNKIRLYFQELNSDLVSERLEIFDYLVPQAVAKNGLVSACTLERDSSGELQGVCETR